MKKPVYHCVHTWVLVEATREECVDCGATCTRDPATHRIVEYDANVPMYAPPSHPAVNRKPTK